MSSGILFLFSKDWKRGVFWDEKVMDFVKFMLFSVCFAAVSQAASLSMESSTEELRLSWNSDTGLMYELDHSSNLTGWVRSAVMRRGTGERIQEAVTNVTGSPAGTRGFFRLQPRYPHDEEGEVADMLSPSYYNATNGAPIREALDEFVYFAQKPSFHHPLQDGTNAIPDFSVSQIGVFGAPKPPPNGTAQHHAAVDLHVGSAETSVELFAAHEGIVATFYDAPKYRNYLSITKPVTNAFGEVLGLMVTLYAHIDLALDEAGGLSLNGQTVQTGELVSRNLYSETMGGSHLHFEIRYYRPSEIGTEEFYAFVIGSSTVYTEPSAGVWSYGFWMPSTGYGFGDPKNHGLIFY